VIDGLAVQVTVFAGLTLWTAVLVRLARRYGEIHKPTFHSHINP